MPWYWVPSVQFSRSVVSDSFSPHGLWASLCITNSWSLLKLMSIESVLPPNHLILCRPSLLLPSVFPSIRVFSSESVLHIRWPKYWSLASASVLPMSVQDIFSFRIDWFDLLEVQGLSRVFSNTTIWKHQFFGAQPSSWSNSHIHIWLPGKPQLWLYGWIFVGKVMSLLFKFHMLPRFIMDFPVAQQ